MVWLLFNTDPCMCRRTLGPSSLCDCLARAPCRCGPHPPAHDPWPRPGPPRQGGELSWVLRSLGGREFERCGKGWAHSRPSGRLWLARVAMPLSRPCVPLGGLMWRNQFILLLDGPSRAQSQGLLDVLRLGVALHRPYTRLLGFLEIRLCACAMPLLHGLRGAITLMSCD